MLVFLASLSFQNPIEQIRYHDVRKLVFAFLFINFLGSRRISKSRLALFSPEKLQTVCFNIRFLFLCLCFAYKRIDYITQCELYTKKNRLKFYQHISSSFIANSHIIPILAKTCQHLILNLKFTFFFRIRFSSNCYLILEICSLADLLAPFNNQCKRGSLDKSIFFHSHVFICSLNYMWAPLIN